MQRGSHGIYTHFSCLEKSHPAFTPTEHQAATVDFFLSRKAFKGLLLYHKLGSGKTCTSILIADRMLLGGHARHIYILTPGSLRKGWITEYCAVCGNDPRYFKHYFTFITYNYNVGHTLREKNIDFNNSLVIIDEVHNLINGVKNRSKNPTIIYDTLMRSNCRILALSGTPIFNYVYEWPLLGNLLKPGAFPNIRQGADLDTHAFMEWFNEEENGTLSAKNRTFVKRRMDGIVSFFPGSGTDYYPSVQHMQPLKALMSHDQEVNYWEQKEQEERLSRPPSKKLLATDRERYELLERLYIMARKYVISRKASNFYYPKNIMKRKDLLVKHGGWVDRDEFKDQRLPREFSTKFTMLLLNLLLHNKQKHVVFTFFKEKSGVILLHTLLGMCGIKSAIFSGDLDDRRRQSVLRRFNAKNNRYGQKIRVLLVTEAGAEGITIKEARHMHILESSPRESKIQQAMGRIVRYKSHYNLPKNEQKVQIWRYWSVASPEPITLNVKVMNPDGEEENVAKRIVNKETIDEILYEQGQRTIARVKSFLEILQEVSVTPYKKIDST
jgi:superfamily II DNA or RNA helicase